MCLENPAFEESWRRDTHTIRRLLNREALLAIDPRKVRAEVVERGLIVARCCDPDQADVTWSLIKEKFLTHRTAPFSDLVGGPRVFPGSRFNQPADVSASWVHGFKTILKGKSVGGIVLSCHMPCLGAFHANVPVEYLFWELKQAKRTIAGLQPQYVSHAIEGVTMHDVDLVVQVDYRDTRECALYLINEPVMRLFLEEEIKAGRLPIPAEAT